MPGGNSLKVQMDNLREITKQEHRRAERTAFMAWMIKTQLRRLGR